MGGLVYFMEWTVVYRVVNKIMYKLHAKFCNLIIFDNWTK